MSIDLNLDRIHALAATLPQNYYTRPTCHIAGTNGKGSVTAILSSIFISSNLSVGRFNSPHLISVYDSILIGNEPVTSDKYAEARRIVDDANTRSGADASSFELLTMTALVVFESAKLDIVVIEVGMGGRLDATNVIPDECILVSALTAVDLDHQAFLGNTVAEIAKEKTGIARKGKPFVLGKQKHEEVAKAVRETVAAECVVWARAVTKLDTVVEAREVSFSSFQMQAVLSQAVQITLPCFPNHEIFTTLSLYGGHQLDNLGLATSIISTLLVHPSYTQDIPSLLKITPKTISRGISSAKWRGRLSFHTIATSLPGRSLSILADGAHNPASSATLGNFIESLLNLCFERPKKLSITLILALSHSPPKTPLQTLAPIFSPSILGHPRLRGNVQVALIGFTPPAGMPWVKSVPASEMRSAVLQLAPNANLWMPADDEPVASQLSNALTWAASNPGSDLDDECEGLVVIAGSLYLVADLYRLKNLT